MENEFYPAKSKAFKNAVGRIAEDFSDVFLSPEEKQSRISKHFIKAFLHHLAPLIKNGVMTQIVEIVQNGTGVEAIGKVYADGIDLPGILMDALSSSQNLPQERMEVFLDNAAKAMTHNLSAVLMENGIPYSEKERIKDMIDPSNDSFQKELARIGGKLLTDPNQVPRPKGVASSKKTEKELLNISVISPTFSKKPLAE